jgi:hypothetical protein
MSLAGQDDDGVYRYTGGFVPNSTGALVYGVRVLPYHPDMLGKHEMALVKWAN